MSRAQEIFDKVLSDGESALDFYIDTRKSEELFLDFKLSSNCGDDNKLSQNDRNSFSKAISGFGNSEGGVIVWGIDCSSDSKGADVAKNKKLIKDPNRFASLLNSAVSGCTIPPHPHVRNEPIEINDNEGYVISYIAKSYYSPHQVVGKLQYYMRAGSSFMPVPHQVLSGMFGKQPQPIVIHQFEKNPVQVDNGIITMNIGFLLKNIGPTLAFDVYFTCIILSSIGKNCEIAFESLDTNYWTGRFSFGRQISAVLKPEIKLPPEDYVCPTRISIKVIPPIEKDLEIRASFGCSGSEPKRFRIYNSLDNLKDIDSDWRRSISRKINVNHIKFMENFLQLKNTSEYSI